MITPSVILQILAVGAPLCILYIVAVLDIAMCIILIVKLIKRQKVRNSNKE